MVVRFLSVLAMLPFALSRQATDYTSYVENCEFEDARNASKISIFDENDVHAGYFNVNRKFGMNLYSVFVKSKQNWKKAPLIVWIQGQPRCTALYGMFGQNGPYYVDKSFNLTKREYAWTNEYNVLYLDNSVGTGYSNANEPSSLLAYLGNIGSYLYEALFQFYQVFPEVGKQKLFLAGEMYSGKYLLLLASVIHRRNLITHVKMNLQGLYIGSGYSDPEYMMEYSTLLYHVGIIDYEKMKSMQILEDAIRKAIRSSKFEIAQQQLQSVWMEMENAGFPTPMDFTKPNGTYEYHIFDYLKSEKFKLPFGLTNSTFRGVSETDDVKLIDRERPVSVKTLLEEDVLNSAKSVLPLLLDNYRILYYSGQFDALVPYVLIENFLRKLIWKGAEHYYNPTKSPRNKWYVEDDFAGYWKTTFNLTEVLVRNSGQMIDVSQPKWAFNLLKTFISNDFKSSLRKK